MSRELKFRAWNKELKVMREPFGLTDIAYGYDCGYKVSDSLPNLGQENHPLDIIMQYTGLKDKNGVEIYEGDVIKNDKYPYPLNVCCTPSAQFYAGDVEMGIDLTLGGFFGSHDDGTPRYERCEWLKCVEVVGNIYDNTKPR